MKKIIVLFWGISSIISCGTGGPNEPKPYEGTWLEITETDKGYVVYNYPSLWDDGETIKPQSITIRNDSLIWVTFTDDVGRYSLRGRDIEQSKDSSYLFPVANYFRFSWVDREKHIARWIIYFSNKGEVPTAREISNELHVDSRYNTYPVVDFEWPKNVPITDAW